MADQPSSRRTAAPRRKWLLPAVAGLLGVLVLLFMAGAAFWRLTRRPAPPIGPRDGLVCLLVNRNSGRCLSVAGGAAARPGAGGIQGPTPDAAGPAERWVLAAAADAFRLRHVSTGLLLEIYDANPNPGALTSLGRDVPDARHQHWRFEPVGDDRYLLWTGHGEQVLAVGQAAPEEGAAVLQWAPLPNVPDQVWELRPAGP